MRRAVDARRGGLRALAGVVDAGAARRQLGDLAAREEALVHAAGRHEPRQRLLVERPALRLEVGRVGPAYVRTLVPVESEPGELLEVPQHRLRARAGTVEVLDAHQESAAAQPGAGPGEERGAGVAEVQPAARRGGEASAVAGHLAGAPPGLEGPGGARLLPGTLSPAGGSPRRRRCP